MLDILDTVNACLLALSSMLCLCLCVLLSILVNFVIKNENMEECPLQFLKGQGSRIGCCQTDSPKPEDIHFIIEDYVEHIFSFEKL